MTLQLIGTEHVSLKNASAATNAGYDWSSCEWYQITDDKDHATGEVRLFLRWAVPLPHQAPMEWQLEVTVIECTYSGKGLYHPNPSICPCFWVYF